MQMKEKRVWQDFKLGLAALGNQQAWLEFFFNESNKNIPKKVYN